MFDGEDWHRRVVHPDPERHHRGQPVRGQYS
jgi:hypothetical protein